MAVLFYPDHKALLYWSVHQSTSSDPYLNMCVDEEEIFPVEILLLIGCAQGEGDTAILNPKG